MLNQAKTTVGRVLYNEPLMHAARRYLARWFAYDTNRRWSKDEPEWFDHRSDLYQFTARRNAMWAERGIYSREVIPMGGSVLDLCCGDGFYSFHFFAERASHIDAVDFDIAAIEHAKRWHNLPNITFRQSDIRTDSFPSDCYDVIVWDAAIEHFTQDEIRAILKRCGKALEPSGVLTGYTILDDGRNHHPEHEHEFASAEELTGMLREVFPAAAVLENTSPDRGNLYFRAGFDPAALAGFRLAD